MYVLQGPAGPPGKNGFPVFIHIILLYSKYFYILLTILFYHILHIMLLHILFYTIINIVCFGTHNLLSRSNDNHACQHDYFFFYFFWPKNHTHTHTHSARTHASTPIKSYI